MELYHRAGGAVCRQNGVQAHRHNGTPSSLARWPDRVVVAVLAYRRYCVGAYTEIRMPLNIRSEEVNRLAETLAARTHRNKTDAVKLALEHELRRLDQALPLRERLRPIQDRVLARPATGLAADKAFYDELSGEA